MGKYSKMARTQAQAQFPISSHHFFIKIMVSQLFFLAALWLLFGVSIGSPISTTTTTPVDVMLGKEQGLVAGATISTENLQKILDGVSRGNRDNIYFYGLLKLYGIGVTKDLKGAAEQFLRASQLGHKEATTAYGVIKFRGDDGKAPDFAMAVKFFRDAVALGDTVSNFRYIYGTSTK